MGSTLGDLKAASIRADIGAFPAGRAGCPNALPGMVPQLRAGARDFPWQPVLIEKHAAAGSGLVRVSCAGRIAPDMKDQLEGLIRQLVERGVPLTAAAEQFEKKYIQSVLERSRGNQSQAARLLGMHRNTLSRKIEEYQLEMPEPAARNGNGHRFR